MNAETAFADPLGRRNLLGAVVTIQRNSVTAPYFGFNNLFRFFDPSANSIRHAGYVSVQRRVSRGLTFTANYTYGKSIDDASDASPDVRSPDDADQPWTGSVVRRTANRRIARSRRSISHTCSMRPGCGMFHLADSAAISTTRTRS